MRRRQVWIKIVVLHYRHLLHTTQSLQWPINSCPLAIWSGKVIVLFRHLGTTWLGHSTLIAWITALILNNSTRIKLKQCDMKMHIAKIFIFLFDLCIVCFLFSCSTFLIRDCWPPPFPFPPSSARVRTQKGCGGAGGDGGDLQSKLELLLFTR